MRKAAPVSPKQIDPRRYVSQKRSKNGIRKYDQKNGTQYYTTLRDYIMEERSIQRTAEVLLLQDCSSLLPQR